MTQPLALLLGVVSEAIVAYALVGACGWGSAWRAALAAVLGTLTTHWAAWWSIIAMSGAIGYHLIVPLPSGRALLASLFANGASAALALALYALGLA